MSAKAAPRVAAIGVAAVSLVAGIAGGLARMGLLHAPAIAVSHHAALMIGGFLGTVISLERAVALGRPAGFVAPLASAAGTLLLLAGWTRAAAACWILAALALILATLALVRRQPMLPTVLLAVASVLWLAGNVAFAIGAPHGVVEAWFGFLILTVAAERLELTRLLPRRGGSMAAFRGAVALLLAAVLAAFVDMVAGAFMLGVALVFLGAWFCRYDIARRTVRAPGVARFAALSLLAGYVWLIVAGVAWIASAVGVATARDLALHGVALGFVFSMIMGHAPIVIPAVTGTRVRFHAGFYLPLALLHASLLLRVIAPLFGSPGRTGGAGNALAIVLFAAMLALSLRARRSRPVPGVIMQDPQPAPRHSS